MINGRPLAPCAAPLGPTVAMKATMPAPATRSPERVVEVNGEEEDTLSKARKAAKVHLHALKEHVEQAGSGHKWRHWVNQLTYQ